MPVGLDDVRAEKVDRDEHGNPIPEERPIEWAGKEDTLRVYPIVGGIANRIAEHEEGLQRLDPQSVAVVLSVCCPDLEDIRAEDVRDMPLPKLKALIDPIEEQMPDMEVDEERGNSQRDNSMNGK